jgi:preprotein translocase subunit SecB
MNETAKSDASEEQRAVFNLQKTYVKDLSFESPQSPQVFTSQAAPKIDIQLNVAHAVLDEEHGIYEVVVGATVTAKMEEDKAVFLAEVQQAGVFQVHGVEDPEREMVLEIACPNILLPFLREAIADIVGKGGFPQLLINPVNFESLYQRKKQAQAGGGEQKVQ